MKTSELIGPALDWAVAKCEGEDISIVVVDGEVQLWCNEDIYTYTGQSCYKNHKGEPRFLRYTRPVGLWGNPMPSYLDWAVAGPIIEREEIALTPCNGAWEATYRGYLGYGSTPLIAAMRCYVASKLGDEVEIPEELK